MADKKIRPPFDPGYKNGAGVPDPSKIMDVHQLRTSLIYFGVNQDSIAKKHPLYQYTDISVPPLSGITPTPVALALYQLPAAPNPSSRSWPNGRPVVYFVHGGGQVAGDRFMGVEFVMNYFEPTDEIVFASPEYRLAPEHRAPAAAHDVYAGLVYLVEHANELNIDPNNIILYGVSGGGAIAAGAALLSRKLGGHKCKALVLNIPMLNDQQQSSVSAEQFHDGTVWPGWMDRQAWDAVLGEGSREDPDGVRVAGRARDLSGLPITFIDIGECEAMRDHAVAFASKIWADGGSAELHVWPGVYHGASIYETDVQVGQRMEQAQKQFLERVLGFGEST